MIDLPSEKKIIQKKFLFFLVDFVRKFAPVFCLKTFLRSPEGDVLKSLSLASLDSLPGTQYMHVKKVASSKFNKGLKPELFGT